MELRRERLVEMLRKMYEIRYFEEKADELYALGKVHGTMHLSIGQEAMAVGAIAALRPEDYILAPIGDMATASPREPISNS